VRAKSGKSVVEELKEGFKYAFGFRPLRSLILLMALVSLIGMPYTTLLPAFAKNVFHGDASTLGFLTAATGFGALVGALFLASRKGVLGLGRWLVIACVSFGLGLVGFGLCHSLHLAMFFLLFVGFGSMVQMASCNTLIQTVVEEDKRGRVMSIYTMAFVGLAPFGSLVAGAVAARIGANETVMISGVLSTLLAIGFASRLKLIRRLLSQLNVAQGSGDAPLAQAVSTEIVSDLSCARLSPTCIFIVTCTADGIILQTPVISLPCLRRSKNPLKLSPNVRRMGAVVFSTGAGREDNSNFRSPSGSGS
jgi:MFS family permease